MAGATDENLVANRRRAPPRPLDDVVSVQAVLPITTRIRARATIAQVDLAHQERRIGPIERRRLLLLGGLLFFCGTVAVNFGAGNREKGVELMEQVRAENPDFLIGRIFLAAYYETEGRHAEARTLVREIRQVVPDLTADEAAEIFSIPLIEVREPLLRAGLP